MKKYTTEIDLQLELHDLKEDIKFAKKLYLSNRMMLEGYLTEIENKNQSEILEYLLFDNKANFERFEKILEDKQMEAINNYEAQFPTVEKIKTTIQLVTEIDVPF